MKGKFHILCITFLAVMSISYCTYNVIINSIPINDVLFQIFVTFVSSIIVFLITVILPQKLQFLKVKENIKHLLEEFHILGNLIDEALTEGKFSDDASWMDRCKQSITRVSDIPNSIPPYYSPVKFQCWFDYFEYLFRREDNYIERILRYSMYLPVEVIDFIGSIEKGDGLRDIIYLIDKQYEWSMLPTEILNELCENILGHRKLLSNCIKLI